MFLADAFLSHVPEASADVGTYRRWIDTQDFRPAYDNLHRMLQLLQWQKRRRGHRPRRWVLKTPAHLGYLEELRRRFPDLHLVHMHRDPGDTIPSGASLNTTLWRMHADEVDPAVVGRQWIERMGWTNDRAMAVRASWGDGAPWVTDVTFAAAVADPMAQIDRIHADLGEDLSQDRRAAMTRWLESSRVRGADRAGHRYRAEDFGLTEAAIRTRFAEYRERFAPI